MKIPAGVAGLVFGAPRAASPFLNHRRPALRVFSSFPEHASFIEDVAAIEPPKHLPQLLRLLENRGESIVSPSVKRGLIPLVIPSAENSSGKDKGTVIGLLRWPTAPAGMEMPVVEAHKHGVCKNCNTSFLKILVDEDTKVTSKHEELFAAVVGAGESLYTKGDFAKSLISDLDTYLIKKVGLFPDVMERRAMQHFTKGDRVAALIMGKFYSKKGNSPGFGLPFVFNAEVLLKVGRKLEAKDAARGALKSPWWTLGCRYQEVARIAEREDEQIEHIKERITEAGRQEDLNKGKDRAQITLDEDAFLLDLASVDGKWDEFGDRIAACYEEAGLNDVAKFIQHRS